jgi:ribonuclease HI
VSTAYQSSRLFTDPQNCCDQRYKKIFTDGSKQGPAVAAAAVTEGKVLIKRLPDNASIFSAESQAILLALDIISQSHTHDFLICSDSLTC